MPAFLLSSAPGNNVSFPGISPLTKSPDPSNYMAQATDLTASFGDSLAASMASLVKVSQSENADMAVDFTKLSTSLEDLSAHLEQMDPALFETLRNFLNGQDLSPQGLENLQIGGELPDFFASLQSSFSLESNMGSLTDLELSALDASMAQISAQILQAADTQAPDEAQSAAILSGFAFTIDKDGKVHLVQGNKADQALDAQALKSATQAASPLAEGQGSSPAYSQAMQSQTGQSGQAMQHGVQNQSLPAATTVPFDQALSGGLNDGISESDKSFNAHLELLKSDMPAEVADSLLESGPELKDKSGIGSRFSDQQYKTLTEPFKPYSTTLMTPVDAQEWADEVSQKIVWFTGRNIQAAEMHLNPADLGPIEVKINVQNEVASVSFNVQNSSVRELLESNVVRLREMMESNGVNLGDVNVDSGTQDAYQQAQQSAQHTGSRSSSAHGEFADDEVHTETIAVQNSNIVDYFV